MNKEKKIFINYSGMTNSQFFSEKSRDNCMEPFIVLKRKCAELGYSLEILENQNIEDCQWLIFFDTTSITPTTSFKFFVKNIRSAISNNYKRNVYEEAIAKNLSKRLVLMLFEPPSVIPQNENKNLHKNFKIIFTWDSKLVDNDQYFQFFLPVTSQYPFIQNISFHEKKMLVDISSNKYSNHKDELYSERRKTILFFEKNYPKDFDLYGNGWNKFHSSYSLCNLNFHFYKSYKGKVIHKWDKLPYYKFAICYENIFDYKDYISQRIFDILRCKSVPIYLGAPNIDDYVDKDSFIDRRNFNSNKDLGYYLANITELEYNNFLKKGQDYLFSERFRKFLSPYFAETILTTLKLQ